MNLDEMAELRTSMKMNAVSNSTRARGERPKENADGEVGEVAIAPTDESVCPPPHKIRLCQMFPHVARGICHICN